MSLLAVALLASPEIVVTAERREAPLEQLPGAAAALSGAAIEAIGPQHPAEALNRLPGVNFQRNNGLESLPAIRSPVLTGGQGAGSVLVLEDGVPIRAAGFGNVNQAFETSLDFAARVEVILGPGSALYGSNAVHGLINVVTPAPGAPVQSLRLEAGEFGRASAQALAVGARSVLGLAAAHEDGWRDQAGFDQQQLLLGWAGAAGGWRLDARLAAQNVNQETAGFIQGEDAYRDRAVARANPVPEAYRDTRLARARLTAERELGETWRLTLTPYARWIEADLNLSFFPSRAQEVTRQAGAGLQAAAYWDPSARLSLIVGADIDRTRGALEQVQRRPTTGTFVQGVQYDYVVDATTAAAFAKASWEIAPRTRLIAGLRGEWVAYAYDTLAASDDFGRFRRPADRTDDFTELTPKLGLVRAFADGGSAYLNYARGARPPQASDLYSLQTTQAPGGQRAETIDAVEAGLRRPILGRGALTLSAYWMEKRDTSFRNALGFTVTDGATRHQGIELSGLLPLGPDAELTGWASLARHTYRFSDDGGPASEEIRAGARVDTAPDTLANLSFVWRPARGVETALDWAHVGAYFTDAGNTRRYPGHDVFTLRAAWDVTERVRLGLALRNLADAAYAERADFAFGADRYFPGEPRALTASLTMRR